MWINQWSRRLVTLAKDPRQDMEKDALYKDDLLLDSELWLLVSTKSRYGKGFKVWQWWNN